MGKNELTSRGGALHQDKNWTKFDLPTQTRFVHCGSAPLQRDGGKGLLLKYSKEIITIAGVADAPSKFFLAYPLLDLPPGEPLPQNFTLSKPCQMLWEMDEMPNCFIFTLDAGTTVWSMGGKVKLNQEVGLAFDVLWDRSLVGEYKRTNKAQAQLLP
jgi:hypothetical protein